MTWDIHSYSGTPSANTSINGTNIAEGCNASNLNDAIRQIMADLANFVGGGGILPQTGDLIPALGSSRAGCVLADGSAISRTGANAALFAMIGTTYGAGDGSTTFNVPAISGRALIGAGAGAGLTARSLGAIGGEETHLLTTAEVPSESVSISGTTAAGGAHTHSVTDPGHSHTVTFGDNNSPNTYPGHGGNNAQTESTSSAATGISIAAAADHTHTFSASGTTSGGGGSHNNMPPFFATNVFIKL